MHPAVDLAQLRGQVGHRELARDHRRESAHHDVADVGIGRQHAQELVAADADDLGRFQAHRLRQAARRLLEQRRPAEDVALLQDLRRLARARAGPERVLDAARDDDVEIVRLVADLVEDRALLVRGASAGGRDLAQQVVACHLQGHRLPEDLDDGIHGALFDLCYGQGFPLSIHAARTRARSPATRRSTAVTSALWKCPVP